MAEENERRHKGHLGSNAINSQETKERLFRFVSFFNGMQFPDSQFILWAIF
jgi:hypothetical protein